ncbi:MAG: 4-hydroxyphenylacetate 3-monooxygenase, oxygenase component [Alphaproteobacteria bacterium]
MAARTGAKYIESLKRTRRDVWLRGRQITDVTTHPAFTQPIRHIARLYDMQHDPRHREILTYPSPSTGQPVGTAFMMARSPADLHKRRQAFQLWAEATFGLIGRTPDFVNTTLMAWAESPDVFGRLGPRFKDNVIRYYEHARENDLFLTHALITPQTDRSKSSAEQVDKFLHLGVVEETERGLVVRGARMLVTQGPIVDDVLVFSLPGLKAGEEPYSMAFAIPVSTPGIRMICREPFDEGGRSSFDHPLATNFEEPDALMIFDDVLVPWDRVFLYGNLQLANAMYLETSLRNHTAHQTSVRGIAKLELVIGTAIAVAEAVKSDGYLHVQNMLGEAIGMLELAKSSVVRAEVEYSRSAAGTLCTGLTPLQHLRGFLPKAYPRAIEILQTIAAGGLLMLPSAADFGSPIAGQVDRFYQGAGGLDAKERVKLFKLAWDLAGDAFGMRQLQYERYWVGDPYRLVATNFLSYEHKAHCKSVVANALAWAGEPG